VDLTSTWRTVQEITLTVQDAASLAPKQLLGEGVMQILVYCGIFNVMN
jgi:hypothetical protein